VNFPEKIKAFREAVGLTQQQLADQAGVPLGTIRNFEQGLRKPLLATAQKLVTALGVSLKVFDDCEFDYQRNEVVVTYGRPKKDQAPAVRGNQPGKRSGRRQAR